MSLRIHFPTAGTFCPEKAIEHGVKWLPEGADIVDVGGESTRPGAEPVALERNYVG